jgi:hypothetical protein
MSKDNPSQLFKENNIKHLTSDHFTKGKLKLKSNHIIMIYADWCGACQRDKKRFVDISKLLQSYTFVVLDGSDDNNPLLNYFKDFNSYPSYYKFDYCIKNGKNRYKIKKLESISDIERLLSTNSCILQ